MICFMKSHDQIVFLLSLALRVYLRYNRHANYFRGPNYYEKRQT